LAILAVTVVLSIVNTDLINSAQNSIDAYELGQIRTLAIAAWSDALVTPNVTTADEYKNFVMDYLKNAGYTDKELDKLDITADINGVNVELKANQQPLITLALDKTEFAKRIEIYTTETETLTATLTGATWDFEWTTSNPDVVEVVGDGNTATVTFKGHGNAIITVTSNGVEATCSVEVTQMVTFTLSLGDEALDNMR
jgi:hypothetical protein